MVGKTAKSARRCGPLLREVRAARAACEKSGRAARRVRAFCSNFARPHTLARVKARACANSKVRMKLMTPVALPAERIELSPESRVLALGSCFAEHVGGLLADSLPERHAMVNPGGVLYNPRSIRATINSLENDAAAPERFSFKGTDGLWRNWLCSGRFAEGSREELDRALQQAWAAGAEALRAADYVFVTLSTDHAYFLRGDGAAAGTAVANCHKQPASLFEERVLDMEEEFAGWHAWLSALAGRKSGARVVFTVSPYRYAKHGLHESALSKARLLLLVDRLCRETDNALYFPAYEIVTDELRDYRFYKADMLHPSDQAVEYVWQRFAEWAFTPRMAEFARERQALLRDLRHRPLHTSGAEYDAFRARTARREEEFRRKWGML